MRNSQQIYNLLTQIPKGQVTTYKILAELINIHPRQVGRILHINPDPKHFPCHRVVNFQGQASKNYAFGGKSAQIAKLKQEGVKFTGDRVDIGSCLFHFC